MLAYVFWHRPAASVDAARYEAALPRAQERPGERRPPRFRGAASFKVTPLLATTP